MGGETVYILVNGITKPANVKILAESTDIELRSITVKKHKL